MAGPSALEALVAAASAAGLRVAVAEVTPGGLADGLRRRAPSTVFAGALPAHGLGEGSFGEADAVRRMAEGARASLQADLGLAVGNWSSASGGFHVGASLSGHVVARRCRCRRRGPQDPAEEAARLGLELIAYLGRKAVPAPDAGMMAGSRGR
jgi:nicotinamide mononucleotide (NMN) deamidase PncC